MFAVGNGGTILHYNGTVWSVMTSGTSQDLSGVWGSSGSNVFAVGYDGTILHYDGSSWSDMYGAGKLDYGTGAVPQSVAMGDLSGDGKPDLAVANSTPGTVSVLLGHGGGTFAGKVDYGTGSGPSSVAMGDLSGDGKLDLAVANSASANVSVLLGNGDGTFGAKTDFGTGIGPFSVAMGCERGWRPDPQWRMPPPGPCQSCWALRGVPSLRMHYVTGAIQLSRDQ